MTLIADIDLDLLKELRKHGSVRNLDSRRKDIYKIEWIGSSQIYFFMLYCQGRNIKAA